MWMYNLHIQKISFGFEKKKNQISCVTPFAVVPVGSSFPFETGNTQVMNGVYDMQVFCSHSFGANHFYLWGDCGLFLSNLNYMTEKTFFQANFFFSFGKQS